MTLSTSCGLRLDLEVEGMRERGVAPGRGPRDPQHVGSGRALRGRGAAEDGDLARPARPSRCTLPITALRVMPPSSAAIWLADSPSVHSFFSVSTRSSVQLMPQVPSVSRAAKSPSRIPLRVWATISWPKRLRRYRFTTSDLSAARDVVAVNRKATIWRESGARVRSGSLPHVPSDSRRCVHTYLHPCALR